MSKSNAFAASRELRVFPKSTMARGQPANIECLEIAGQVYAISRGVGTVVSLEDEWFEDVADPLAVIEVLKSSAGFKPDVFTFWQRDPDVELRYPFHVEWEEIAALPTEGAAWESVLEHAMAAPGAPNLADQDQDDNIHVLARAFVCVRLDDEAMCESVRSSDCAWISSKRRCCR